MTLPFTASPECDAASAFIHVKRAKLEMLIGSYDTRTEKEK